MPNTYTTISGDMWDTVAYKVYGDESYMDKLIAANLEYRHIFIFPAGVELVLPDKAIETSANLPPWKRGAL